MSVICRVFSAGLFGYIIFGQTATVHAEPLTPVQFCESAKKQAVVRSKLARVFALVPRGQDPDSTEGDWAEFPDVDTRNKIATLRPIYDMASAWTLPSGILFVSTLATSSSADWNDYTDYCYRPNGTLAWMESELRTLPRGGARRIRTWVFSQDGNVVSQVTRVLDLVTGKPLKTSSYIEREEPIFLTPQRLPFTELLAIVYRGRR